MPRSSVVAVLLLILASSSCNAFDNLYSLLFEGEHARSSPLNRRDYNFPELSCPQNPQPVIPLPQKILTKLQDAMVRLETQLNQAMIANKIPGMAVSVVYDQKTLWARGLGFANVSAQLPVTPDTPFRIGSVSKVFAPLMLLQLRDKGLIDLDEEISERFPQVKILNPFPTQRGITYRHLGSHMAAVPRSSPCDAIWGNCNLTTTEILARVATEDLIQPIGDMPAYSNFGVALLGRLLEEIVGMKYEDYVHRFILSPLGMTNTGFTYPPDVASKMAVGYLFDSPVAAPLYEFGWESPAGSMYSTVNDLNKLLSLLFRDNLSYGSSPSQILDGQTIKEWLYPGYVTAIASGSVTSLGLPWEGNIRNVTGRNSAYWQKGKNGAVLGYTAQILSIPSLKLGVSALLNAGLGGPAGVIADMVMQAALDVLDSSLVEFQQPPPLPPNPSRYIGNYTAVVDNPPYWLDSIYGNISLATDANGHPRMLLQYGAYVLSSSTPVSLSLSFIDYQPQVQQFQLTALNASCPGTLGGGNQYVVFSEQASGLSFRIGGLFWGITWYKS